MKTLLTIPFVLALASCPTPPAPLPTPPPVSSVRAVALVLHDRTGADVKGATCDIQVATDAWVSASGDGYLVWKEVPTSLRNTQVKCAAAGYVPLSEGRVLLTGENEDLVRMTLASEFTPLPRLRVRKEFFEQENGQRFSWVGASDYNLLNRFLDGEDIEPILAQRQAVGFNALRVWTRMRLASAGIGDLTLADHPDLYARIPAFLQAAAKHGFYVEFTAYIGDKPVDDYDPQHWDRLVAAACTQTNALAELMNENDIHPLLALASFTRPTCLLASRGSNGGGSPPVGLYREPNPPPEHWAVDPRVGPWDYMTSHENGQFEEARKVGHSAMEYADTARRADVTNEQSRATDQYNSPIEACDRGASAALLAAGSTFHSISGKNSTLWTGDEFTNAIAYAKCAREVDLACQDGPYINHPETANATTILRDYERPVAGHDCRRVIHR